MKLNFCWFPACFSVSWSSWQSCYVVISPLNMYQHWPALACAGSHSDLWFASYTFTGIPEDAKITSECQCHPFLYPVCVFFCPEYFILIISALKKLYVARIQFNNNFFPLVTRKQGGNLNNFETYLAPTQPTLLLQPRAIYLDNCIIKVLA